MAAAALIAGVFYFYQPSYSGSIDAPVKLVRSPVTGFVLTASGESGLGVRKGESLFSIKNANDGSDRVREAKDQTAALEGEIALLSSLRTTLVRRQISRGLPRAGLGDRSLDSSPALWGREKNFPDAPNRNGFESGDYLAIRLAEVNAKLESTTIALESSKRALADAEAEFRANEKADVVSPAAGAIQSMHVSPGSPLKEGLVLAEVVSSEEAFIEAAIPKTLAVDAVGRKVRVLLDGSSSPLDGEIVAVGPETGWNSKQTAVSLASVPEGYVIVDVWIAQQGWSGDVGFASQIARKAKITLK